MPPRWCRKSPTDIADIDAAMRLGYTWKFGPFELIDQLGAEWVASHLAELGLAVPPILQKLGRRQILPPGCERRARTIHARWQLQADPPARRACCSSTTSSACRSRCSATRPPPPGISATACCASKSTPKCAASKLNMLDGDVLGVLEKTMALVGKSYKALVIYNDDLREAPHKTNFSTGANIGMALSDGQYPALGQNRRLHEGRPETLPGHALRPLPHRRRAGRPGAWRRLRDAAALLRRAGLCGELYRPGRSRRRPRPRLGRLLHHADALAARQTNAERPDAGGGQSVRDHLHRHRLAIRGGGHGAQIPARRPTASP